MAGRFIAIDGEGTTERDENGDIVPGGKHYYNLLCAHTPDGPRYIESYDPELRTRACIDFLIQLAKDYPNDIFVVYGGSYDFNMMLGDATKDNIAELWAKRDDDTNYTALRGGKYEVSFLPKKYYKARIVSNKPKFLPTGRKNVNGEPEYRRNTLGSIVVWDVVGFFQSSFVKALEGYKIGSPSLIAEMKTRRSQFTSDERDTIREYCFSECALLVQLMDKLREALITANITLRRWDGAGSVAASLMMREKVKEHKAETPESLRIAVRTAYYGGRIEMGRYGVIDKPIYQYDINSAYPSVMCDLPSLAGGRWVKGDSGVFSIHKVKWDLPDCAYYPFPYRTPDGRIYYPPRGETWVWSPELRAAKRHNPTGIDVLESYTFIPSSTYKPFGFIPTLFEQRRAFKREGNMAEKALKLGINSLYGKTAQQKGGKVVDGKVIPPPFFQLEWAGYITSATRARLYDAAMQTPDNVVMLCTDGIFSLKPLDLPVGGELGQWEYSEHSRGVVAQSGVYWMGDSCGGWIEHYRGFDPGSLDVADVAAALRRSVGKVTARQTRFVTMGQALHTDFATWRRWITKDRDLRLTPEGTKRRRIGPDKDIRKTRCNYVPYADIGELSEPFKIEWLDGLENMPADYRNKVLSDDMGYE